MGTSSSVGAVVVRRAFAIDAEEIASLEYALFPENSLSSIGIERELEASVGFVATLEGRVVGYALLRLPSEGGDFADLLRLGVAEEARARGVGWALLGEAIAATPYPLELGLLVRRGNTPARALYRRAGFRLVGRLEDSLVLRREGTRTAPRR